MTRMSVRRAERIAEAPDRYSQSERIAAFAWADDRKSHLRYAARAQRVWKLISYWAGQQKPARKGTSCK